MDLIPPLRADVRVEDLPSGKALFDAALNRRVKLDARGAAIALRLAAGAPVSAREIAEAEGVDVAAVEKLVAGLARLNLLATPTATERVAVERVARAAPASVPIKVRDDARITCTMCGGCCGGHMVGPVSQEVLEGLDDAQWSALERDTGSHKGLFFALPAADAAEVGQHVVCHASGGSCVFLTDDRKCLIHKRHGGDKKPEPCRIFPYEMIATPDGVVVTVQRECRGFLEAGQGKRLADDLDELRAVLALVPERAKVGSARLRGEVLPWDGYLALEERLHAVVDASDNEEVFAALWREVGAAVEDDAAALAEQLDRWTSTFRSVLDGIAAAAPDEDERVLIRLDGLEHLRKALVDLRPDLARVVLPLDRQDQRALLKDHLHHALMGKALVQAPSIEVGLARLAAQWHLTKSLALGRAREVKRRHLVAQDVMDALVIVSFMFRHADLQAVITALDAQTAALFGERLSALRAVAKALPDADTRVELVKF